MFFEDAHDWIGDAVQNESAEFQNGKHTALQKLLPFTAPHSAEAACVVLRRDGSLWRFEVGLPDEVDIEAPAHEPVALLHTHTNNQAHSEKDWLSFLCFPNLQQSHVVAPDLTFSLHKPVGWKTSHYGLEELRLSDIEGETEAAIELNTTKVLNFYFEAIIQGYKREGGWSVGAEARVRAFVTKQMATHFGVNCRIGKRR